MSLVAVTGDIAYNGQEATVEWEIEDFSSLSDKTGCFYTSPSFYFCNFRFRSTIYPNGETRNGSEGYVSLFLLRPDSCCPVTFQYSLKKPKNVKFTLNSPTEMEKGSRGMGVSKFVARSDLLSLKPPVTLVVSCHLTYAHRCSLEGTLFERLWNLSQNFKTIQNVEKYSDYTVKVEGRKFYCHRAILASRSDYFSALFDTDMEEKKCNEVEIEDMEESVFQLVLSYIYCGDLTKISEQNVCKLYVASDKLLLKELKKTCTEYMKTHMGLNTFCDAISIAKMYQDEELEKCALDYFTQHSGEVLKSQNWKEFKQKKNLEFVNEVLEVTMMKMPEKRPKYGDLLVTSDW